MILNKVTPIKHKGKTISPTFPGVYILLFLVGFISCTTPKESSAVSDRSHWIPFEWSGIKSGEKYLDKAAMFVPFRIEGIPYSFKSQFDLGATHTMVYGNSFQPYLDLHEDQLITTDTSASNLWMENKKRAYFSETKIFMGDIPVTVPKLVFLDNFGIKLTADSLNSNKVRRIGTVGAEIFKDKILIIDYPNQKMKILDSLDSKTETAFDFVQAKLERGRIKIPFTIQNDEHWFMFDTGASLFPVSTSPENYKRFANTAIIDSLETTTWGKKYWVYGSPLKSEIKIGSTTLPKLNIYSLPNFTEFFEREKITGITGNAFFLNSVIAIDFKNARFGIMRG